jgi:hypothetical protein
VVLVYAGHGCLTTAAAAIMRALAVDVEAAGVGYTIRVMTGVCC